MEVPIWRSLWRAYVSQHKKTASEMKYDLLFGTVLGPLAATISLLTSQLVMGSPSSHFLVIFSGLFIVWDPEPMSRSIEDTLMYDIPWISVSLFTSLIFGSHIIQIMTDGGNIALLAPSFALFAIYGLVAMSISGLLMSLVGVGIRDSLNRVLSSSGMSDLLRFNNSSSGSKTDGKEKDSDVKDSEDVSSHKEQVMREEN